MSIRLTLFILCISLIFLIYILRNVKTHTLSVRNSLLWIILLAMIILSVGSLPLLERIAHFFGIETVSNMLFFAGFLFLMFICFDCTKTISRQNEKILRLTQELALLEKKYEDDEKTGLEK